MKWFRNQFNIKKPTKKTYMFPSSDTYELIEVTVLGVQKLETGNLDELSKYVADKYRDQPLQYFNEMQRLKIVHLKTATVKNLSLTVNFNF
jgi:hypothetical protein